MRAAIYARMSTGKQSETSPEEQVAECRRYAEENGLEVPEDLVFIDRALSGATAARPQYQAMRAALQAGASGRSSVVALVGRHPRCSPAWREPKRKKATLE